MILLDNKIESLPRFISAQKLGTGKTDLARRILRELGNKIIDDEEPIEAVASYEWERYEVIGGMSITSNGDKDSFQGCDGLYRWRIRRGLTQTRRIQVAGRYA